MGHTGCERSRRGLSAIRTVDGTRRSTNPSNGDPVTLSTRPAQTSVPSMLSPGATEPFAMQDVICGSKRTLRLAGELDLVTAPLLEAALRLVLAAPAVSVIELDLSRVTFMDSSGLRSVLLARDLCAQGLRDFQLVPGPSQVQRLFEITGTLGLLTSADQGAGRS